MNELSATSSPVTVAIIGCGERGLAYAGYALRNPTRCKVVAVVDPRPFRRSEFAKAHSVQPNLVFKTWQDFEAASTASVQQHSKKLCDALVVAVGDALHAPVVTALAKQGYHILCEKPMAVTIQDCMRMYREVSDAKIIFGMGHVLRYSPYSQAITDIIQSGSLGQLINAVQIEPVGYFHFAHSYVRGNWHSEALSSFSLMTKSCHDIDILCHWMKPATPVRVSSFGSLSHFRKDRKPAEAGDAKRCLDCPIKEECPYSAKRIYLDRISKGYDLWPVRPLVDELPDIENITDALKNGPYGVCVYESPNDVCDHQVVNIEFSNGSTVSFTMVAFTDTICERETRLHFTHGEIIGNMSYFTVSDFRKPAGKDRTRMVRPQSDGGGHGGGDTGLMRSFVNAVTAKDQSILGTDVGEVLNSHLTVFAAEKARRTHSVVEMDTFKLETATLE
ncbi:NAD-P-binding protein [Sistotremastrum niveocremeum HHB9708]|uniref:NAD-P-binding protein n=1 Tax=Sistotremastrum niveocremeum HHB9708 TaxID=1314777 RepID=A0A164Z4I6_9AGAM|nr:NAD-P-binding protein [Sistotremastrum niveocremeum HHB9708]